MRALHDGRAELVRGARVVGELQHRVAEREPRRDALERAEKLPPGGFALGEARAVVSPGMVRRVMVSFTPSHHALSGKRRPDGLAHIRRHTQSTFLFSARALSARRRAYARVRYDRCPKSTEVYVAIVA